MLNEHHNRFKQGGASVSIKSLRKTFGNVVAVDDISLEVLPGEFLTLLGPSGSGKTTVLNLIAGFEPPTAGEVFIDSQPVTYIPPYRRYVGMVFQNYALFPHLTVFKNIAFPLEMQRFSASEVKDKVAAALELVRLSEFSDRYPRQLSGGQQQRVALARALVFQPSVLLMDEPLGALDKKLRLEMQVEIKQLQVDLGNTVIYVTHDQEEALTMSDRVAIFHDGRVMQVGPPRDIYDHPANCFVADFIGESNILRGQIIEQKGDQVLVLTEQGLKVWAPFRRETQTEQHIAICIRPERILMNTGEHVLPNNFAGHIQEIIYLGNIILYKVRLLESGHLLTVQSQDTGVELFNGANVIQVGWQLESSWLVFDSLVPK